MTMGVKSVWIVNFVSIVIIIMICMLPLTLSGQDQRDSTASKLLEAITVDIGTVIDESAGMVPGDAQSAIERIGNSWDAFTDIYRRDPWRQDVEIDSVVKAADGMLVRAKSDLEKKGIGGAADACAGALPLLKTLILEFNKPILADFSGATCKICKIMKTRLAKINEEYKDRIKIIIVDVNKQRELTKQYKIMLIPTLVFIDRSGKEVDRRVGEMEEKAVKTKLNELLEI